MNDSLAYELFNQCFTIGTEVGMEVLVFVSVGCLVAITIKALR